MTDETKPEDPGSGAWDATQWHEVVSGDILIKSERTLVPDLLLIPAHRGM